MAEAKVTERTDVVYINGRFLSQRVSGVQRFARELVAALDAELGRSGDLPFCKWVLLVPHAAADDLRLRNIEQRRVGWGAGHLWDQLWFPFAARDGVAVSLANNGAVLHRRSLTVLHDAMVFRTPDNYSAVYRLFHQTLGRLLAKRSHIGTVSRFSQQELADVLGLDHNGIFLIPNGCEHLDRVVPDPDVLVRLGVKSNRYFLFVGSLSPNKNLMRAVEAFASLAQSGHRLVIVGATNAACFEDTSFGVPPDVILAGYLSDGEIAALYREATALVFPSLYEGFGIPPLEAMVLGCPVLAADIPAVREVCADSAIYFNPLDVGSIARALFFAANSAGSFAPSKRDTKKRCLSYNWSESARRLIAAVNTYGA